MTANATHPGRITIPGTDLGVRGTLVAEPQTEDMLLSLDDRLALGPVKVDTDQTGTLEAPLTVPIVSGVLWLLRFEPHRHDIPDFVLGIYNLNTSGVDLKDLIATNPLAVDATLQSQIAAAAALGATNDTATASFFNNPASATVAAASAGLKGKFAYPSYYDAENYKTGSLTDLQAIQAACAAATAAGRGASVRLSSRVWDVGNGLSMSGYSCGLVGMGGSYTPTVPSGTVIYGSSQTGAVIDLTGWLTPGSFRGVVEFGKFAVRGSNAADATKAKAGIKHTGTSISGMWWHDVVIAETGGPCVDLKDFYLSTMERVVCCTPVSAKANDVPYAIFRGANGSTFNGLGFRSMLSSADMGAGGALVITDDGTDASSNAKFNSTWFEFLHLPTNGAFIDCAANSHQFQGTYFTDVAREAGATGCYYVRFNNVVNGSNFGANIWRGVVPGTEAAIADGGIKVSQKNNRIEGPKGFNGNNVTIDSGVTGCYVSLGGAQSGTPGTSAFTNNSGNTTNTLLDFFSYPNTGVAATSLAGVVGELTTQPPVSVANTVTATQLWTAPTIPASALTAGTTKLTLRVAGKIDAIATSGTFSGRIYVNGASVLTVSAAVSQTSAGTNRAFMFEADIYVDAVGSSGAVSIYAATNSLAAGGTTYTNIVYSLENNTRNLTTGLTIGVGGAMATADPGNVFYLTRATLTREA